MAIRKPAEAAKLLSEKVSALTGSKPGPLFRNKPFPLEKTLRQDAQIRKARFAETARLNRALLAPVHRIISGNAEAVAAAKKLGVAKRLAKRKPDLRAKPRIENPVRSGSILTFRGLPYDQMWNNGTGELSDSGNYGFGIPNASEGNFIVETNVSDGSESVWAGAGIAVWFQPIANNTFVRFGADTVGYYSWDDDSWGYAAHNNAFIGVLIESWDLRGQTHQIDVDRRITQWSDGTGWYENHNNQLAVSFPSDTYFFANADRQYRVWMWAEAWCDAEGSGLFGSSAASYMFFNSYVCVFEQSP